jgi:hypothetical protein
VVQIQRSLVVVWDALVGKTCEDLRMTYLDDSFGVIRWVYMQPWRWIEEVS